MSKIEVMTSNVHGMYRDVLRDAAGCVQWDGGWQKNAIVFDCRRLLASFMRGAPPETLGIQGLQVGAGEAAWDQLAGPLSPTAEDTALLDPHPFTVQRTDLQIDFLARATDSVSNDPTNRLQIVATLGPGMPPWPDPDHTTSTLREFGLVGKMNGATVLINYVRHVAIVKDPTSKLERTIWLVF
jgi:hypothetical protein